MKYTTCIRAETYEGFVYPLDLDTMILAFHFAVAQKSRVLAARSRFIGRSGRPVSINYSDCS